MSSRHKSLEDSGGTSKTDVYEYMEVRDHMKSLGEITKLDAKIMS